MDEMTNNRSLSTKTRTASQTAVFMAILTLVAKLLGFVRETVIAGAFGTSYVVDAYVMAQSIPSMLFGGILGAVGGAYLPVFSEIAEKRGKAEGDRYTGKILSIALLVSAIVGVLGFAFSDQIVTIFAKNFSAEAAELTGFYLKVAFCFSLFTSTTGILDSYLRYHDVFLLQIVGGYLYDIGIIAMALISARTNVRYLIFGMLIGHFLQFGTNSVWAVKRGLVLQPSIQFDEPVRRSFRLALPVFIGTYLSQVNTFVDKMLASGLQEGSIAALNYGILLIGMVNSLTTTIILTVLYPKITQAVNVGDWDRFYAMMQRGAALIIMIGVPFCLGAIGFSDAVVQVVYERGSFSEASTAFTANAFLFYAPILIFSPIGGLLSNACYSTQDMKTPIVCSAISIATNIILNLCLVNSLQHKGLALATSIASAVNCVTLSVFVRKKFDKLNIFPPVRKILVICLCAVASVLSAVFVYHVLCNTIWMPRVLYLGCAVGISVIVYLALFKVFRIEEVEMLKELIHR